MTRLTVFIGRFQPIHAGHMHVIDQALSQSQDVLVLVGSANRPRSWKNPFTFQERLEFIKTLYPGTRLHVEPLNDYLYDDPAWTKQVTDIAHATAHRLGSTEIAITGFDKDQSSRYLSWFPNWTMLPVTAYRVENDTLHATAYREALFSRNPVEIYHTGALLNAWMENNQETIAYLLGEKQAVCHYRDRLARAGTALGYPVSIPTVDALVRSQGKVLLVQRHTAPGKGLWALPGGHVDHGETSQQAVLRELTEEAGLDLPQTSIKGSQVFDNPNRSERGWLRTEAFLIDIPEPVKTYADGHETRATKWVLPETIDPTTMFEDHYDIIQTMLA